MFVLRAESHLLYPALVSLGLVLLTILCIVLYLTRRDARVCKFFKSWNGPTPLPIVGNALLLFGLPHEYILKHTLFDMLGEYGGSFAAWMGNIPYVMLSRAADIEIILSSTVHTNKGKDYEEFVKKWLRTGLLTAPREKWIHRRKLLTPAFHFKILEDFIPIFNEQSKVMNEMLERKMEQTCTFDICPFLSNLTLDVICETAMGIKINAQKLEDLKYAQVVSSLAELLINKGLNPAYRYDFIWNLTSHSKVESEYLDYLCDYTTTTINRRKALRLQNQQARESCSNDLTNETGIKTRKAFLDLLLDLQETDESFTDDDIREEVDTFMFEGHDTTGASLKWTILMLALNPQHQKLVHEELDQIFGSDGERHVTSSDVKELKYLECCIKETLRLFPSIPFFLRRADQDIQLDERRTIPKGVSVAICNYALHRDANVFPDPEKFDPERFNAENSVGRNPYAYIPFSAGPRNCIGQKFALLESKIILSTLLRKFRLEAVDTVDTAVPLPDVILRPKNGVRVTLVRRNIDEKFQMKRS